MILTDSHTHLYAEQFKTDIDDAVKRANEAGVTRFFLPNIDSTSIEPMLSLVNQYPEQCFPMMGLHPTSVNASYQRELGVIEKWFEKEKFYAIGEIGIDLYWDRTFAREQEVAFRSQIELAKELDLPIVIHSRESFDEIFTILDEVNDTRLRGIFHCFTGTIKQAEKILDYESFYLGIGGVVTYKNSGLDKVIKNIGLEHIVLETDSPYLAPVPYRGKRNESAYLLPVAEKVAEIKNENLITVAEITTENTVKIFGK